MKYFLYMLFFIFLSLSSVSAENIERNIYFFHKREISWRDGNPECHFRKEIMTDISLPYDTSLPQENTIEKKQIDIKEVRELLKDAEEFREKGFYDSAIAIYREIMDAEPDNTENLIAFGDLMVEMENYSYAVLLYNKYLSLKPEDLKIRKLVIDIYKSVGSDNYAIEECIEFLKNNPNNTEILLELAELYRINKIEQEEMLVMEKIVNLEPDNTSFLDRIMELYMSLGKYEKAYDLLANSYFKDYSSEKKAYIYLNAEKYEEAIEIYEELYRENPSEDNLFTLNQAELSYVNYTLSKAPRFYSSYYNRLKNIEPPNKYSSEILDVIEEDVKGVYTGAEFKTGSINNNDYSNYYGSVFYPVFSTGTEILVSFNRYVIESERTTGIYNKTELELRQALSENFALSGGFSGGSVGSTYYGQLSFQGDFFEFAVRKRKDFVLETAEALENSISYDGMDYYFNIMPHRRFNFVVNFGDYDYSDGNSGTYHEVGGFFRVWENMRNSWLNLGISHAGTDHDYISPFYYSPSDLSQWNYSLEWYYYWRPDSLFTLGYTFSSDNLNNNFNSFRVYGDHKFNDRFFVYGEYINGIGLSRGAGILDPDSRDYEFTMGMRYKF